MKRLIALCCALSIALSLSLPAAAAAQTVSVSIDGQAVPFTTDSGSPFIDKNNRTLVPLRVTMETYGCEVFWDNENRDAIVYKDGVTVVCGIGENHITVNGNAVAIDTASVIKDSRTYLPIRCVLEAVGATVGWDNATRTVLVTRGETDVLLDQAAYTQQAMDAIDANTRLNSKFVDVVKSQTTLYLQHIPVDEAQIAKMCARLKLVSVREGTLGSEFSGQCTTRDSRNFTITLDTNKIPDEEEYARVMFHELCHMFSNVSTTNDWLQEGMTTVLEMSITGKDDTGLVLYDMYYRTCLLLLEVLGEDVMLQAYLTGDESLIYAALNQYAGISNAKSLLCTHVESAKAAMVGGIFTWMGKDQGKSEEVWQEQFDRSTALLAELMEQAYIGRYGTEPSDDPLFTVYLTWLKQFTFFGTMRIVSDPSIVYEAADPSYFGQDSYRSFAVIKDKSQRWCTDGQLIVYRR